MNHFNEPPKKIDPSAQPSGGVAPRISGPGSAYVVEVQDIRAHPNADRLEILDFGLFQDVSVVTGVHYRVGQLGIWIPPGQWIPGYLAKDLWLSKKGEEWFEVREIEIRGVPSPGLFIGQVYMNDARDYRSRARALKLKAEGGEVDGEWISWPLWCKHWQPGNDVGAYLGVAT